MADPLARLHEIRMPEETARAALADGAAALAIGLAAALIASLAVRALSARRAGRRARARAALAASRRLAGAERLAAQAALLRSLAETAPGAPAPDDWAAALAARHGRRVSADALRRLRAALYRPVAEAEAQARADETDALIARLIPRLRD